MKSEGQVVCNKWDIHIITSQQCIWNWWIWIMHVLCEGRCVTFVSICALTVLHTKYRFVYSTVWVNWKVLCTLWWNISSHAHFDEDAMPNWLKTKASTRCTWRPTSTNNFSAMGLHSLMSTGNDNGSQRCGLLWFEH